MCGVAEAAIGMGVLSMGSGIMQAQDEAAYANAVAQQKYQQAKAQAERNNQIATQQYNNRLRIAKQKDEIKKPKPKLPESPMNCFVNTPKKFIFIKK